MADIKDRPPELVKWLRFLKIEDCACSFAYLSLGMLHRVSMGKGWVRTTTVTDCPQHGFAVVDPKTGLRR